ncbi:BREX system serine/threonine kinase PglW [Rhodococcus sp. 1R11]|uniref:BREX system serine/threonine kinase PglW n=1 Tax=Rhodococcus sp. 1R11 TaxID=2559614 RepID=UPI00107285EF|nr:BREX system serine/threonine kinase PglW [Rhodococcus sp. 1R11]TFI42226.1 BREX system serine/threonine kinase PglW [Rhodococcus sp. 1R11]
MKDGRWIEVSPSQFKHEQEGLETVKTLLPDATPFRAWSNFEFRDKSGRWHEVDLLVLARDTLYLVELKHYRGTIKGNDHMWSRDGRRSEDSPLLLARRKAQRFASLLRDTLSERAGSVPRGALPFVQELVYLHHPDTRCALPEHSKINLYGRDGDEQSSGLPGLSQRLLAPATRAPVSEEGGLLIAELMKVIGLAPRRQREVGSWIIDETPLADGEGWQDWPAFHHVDTERHVRIRFYVPRPGASAADEYARKRAVEHEFRLLARLKHEGLQVPTDLVSDAELGVGLVFPSSQDEVPLDLWLADRRGLLTMEQQLDLVAQLAEIVQYAHRNRVVHRSLNPRAVSIRQRGSRSSVQILDWDTAGVLPANADTGVTRLSEGPLSLMAGTLNESARTFAAPEGMRPADPARLDVFGLGALAFFIFTDGIAPASELGGLHDRLRRDGGLDLAAELPQVPTPLRQFVLQATNGSPASRTDSVAKFTDELVTVREDLLGRDEGTDPLTATPGTELANGRFVVKRRLGSGSTAVGLLVDDKQVGAERVLKVALNSDASERIRAEAQVLGKLENEERVVTLHGVEQIGGHTALILKFAGRTTLAEQMASRSGGLSLDQLEHWGADLLAAVVGLERSGVMHRDIKPSNLGVWQPTATSDTHLVMYDFSMAGVDVKNIEAGSPPYLDPFLGTENRKQYDTAAERYGAGVVLYEMATGSTPQYGMDPNAHPAAIPDDIHVATELLDPAIRLELTAFFQSALARALQSRPDTAEDMLRQWREIFTTIGIAGKVDADSLAADADEETLLSNAGLTARAASALSTVQVTTVGELLALDVTPLNRLVAKESRETRREIKDRYREWNKRLGKKRDRSRDGLMGLDEAVGVLLSAVTSTRGSATRRQAAEAILGVDPALDEFASVTELATHLKKATQRGLQLIKELQADWANDPQARALLDALLTSTKQILDDSGGVAAVTTLREEVRAKLPASDAPTSDLTAHTRANRLAGGLLRVALDRLSEWEAASGTKELVRRRHGRRLVLIATDEMLLAGAESAARRADELVAADSNAVIRSPAAEQALRTAFVYGYRSASDTDFAMVPVPPGHRLIRLSAAGSTRAGVTGRGELYNLAIAPSTSLSVALSGIAQSETLSPSQIQSRVAARFPAIDKLPHRPRLDNIIEKSQIGLLFDGDSYRFQDSKPPSSTTMHTRADTFLGPTAETDGVDAQAGRDAAAEVLQRSIDERGFLVIGVSIPATRPSAHLDAADTLADTYGGEIFDITGQLIDAMATTASNKGISWELVRASDAVDASPTNAKGLRQLLALTLPGVIDRVREASFSNKKTDKPLVLVEPAALARFEALDLIPTLSDLSASRARAVWLVLPQTRGQRGLILDKNPLQLSSPGGQFVAWDSTWSTADTTQGAS